MSDQQNVVDLNRAVDLSAVLNKEVEESKNNMTTELKIKPFDPNTLSINEFSEFNDPNIYIQDGPLACYCSHVRSMIYSYTNFDPSAIN